MPWKRSFFTIAAGQSVSLIGSSAVQFAMIWWLSVETASPMALSLAGLAAFLPSFLLGPFAGVWVDRLRRKQLVIAADLFMGFLALAFAAWFHIAKPPYWSIGLILFARGVGGVFHAPALQSLIPSIVPKEELLRANSWVQFMQSGAFMLGPVLGGLMYSWLPMSVILATDFFGALAASAAVLAVPIDEPEPEAPQHRNFMAELRGGVSVFLENRVLLSLLIATFVCMVCFMPLSSLYPLMTSSYFKLDAFYGSLVEFGFALGMLGISLLMGIFSPGAHKLLIIHGGLWAMGLSSFLSGLLPDTFSGYWMFAALCALMGAGGNLYGIPVTAYMQETIDPARMGRAFSLWGMALSAAMPLGLLISGPVAEYFGVKIWFLISGIVMLLAATVNYLYLKKR